MGRVKKINIKNKGYYFFDNMIDIKYFHSNLIIFTIDIYYVGYITIKKFTDCENIHSVNPLYLINHSATRYLKKKKVKNT